MTLERPQSAPIVWLNGRFLPLGKAAISPMDRGFLYGDGVFETMRAEAGCVLFLEDHLRRLRRSLTELGIRLQPEPEWNALLCELLQRNRLSETCASAKIVVSRGTTSEPGLPIRGIVPTIFMIARPYQPPAPHAYRTGWRLHVLKEGFSPPLAAYKSLNYLYFLKARQAALDAQADEAVILDPQGYVTETSVGSLLAKTNGTWWTPSNPYQLPSTTLGQVVGLLGQQGVTVARRYAGVEDIIAAQTLWVLNSLMLIMPASHINGCSVAEIAAEEASRLRNELTAGGKKR